MKKAISYMLFALAMCVLLAELVAFVPILIDLKAAAAAAKENPNDIIGVDFAVIVLGLEYAAASLIGLVLSVIDFCLIKTGVLREILCWALALFIIVPIIFLIGMAFVMA